MIPPGSQGIATPRKIGTVAMMTPPARTSRARLRGYSEYQIATPTIAMTNDGCSAL
jgi:hypothetical protein